MVKFTFHSFRNDIRALKIDQDLVWSLLEQIWAVTLDLQELHFSFLITKEAAFSFKKILVGLIADAQFFTFTVSFG